MKTIFRITLVAGVIIFVGVCNETATLTQTIYGIIAGALIIAISAILLSIINNEWYKLTFIDNKGHHKYIRAYSCIGKMIAICKYYRLGYRLYTEVKYGNEI
jgi:hypothetical protein